MIKRRFYKLEHGGQDAASDASSSSDSEVEMEAEEESEQEDSEIHQVREKDESTSSGYETEDSSANEVDVDSSDLPSNDAEIEIGIDKQNIIEGYSSAHSKPEAVGVCPNPDAKEVTVKQDLDICFLKQKAVFKCRLCPRIVCLSEESLNAHLISKRHARSVKLLSEGRLKLILNLDGEIEEGNYAASDSPIVASAQTTTKSKRKNEGRQRQRKRLLQKKARGESKLGEARSSTTKKSSDKKRHKSGK